MSRRIRSHLRGNVVGYIALFFVLTGGTATALDGSNTVFSDDIVNGEVKAGDLAGRSVTGGKIRDGQVGNPDLAADAVTGEEVADFSLTGADVFDNSLTGADVNESTLGEVPSALTGG